MSPHSTAAPHPIDTAESLQLRYAVAVLLAIGITVLALYWKSFAWLMSEWSTGNSRFSHGYLLTAICLFLLFRSVRHLELRAVAPNWWALSAVLVASLVWLVGGAGNVVAVQTFVIPMLLLTSVWAVLGYTIARQLAFAILYFVFALPVWEYLQVAFLPMTIAVVTFLLKLINVPAVIETNMIHLGGGSFRIASGCSGITFLVVGLALGALYGHLFYQSARSKWLLLTLAFAISVLSNWIRVTAIIYIGYASRMQSSIVDDHHAFGWLVFALFLVPLFVMARRIEVAEEPHVPRPEAGIQNRFPKSSFIATVAAIALLAVGPVWSVVLTTKQSAASNIYLSLPRSSGDWTGPAAAHSDWQPLFHGASAEAIAVYHSAQGPVYLYNGVYSRQKQGHELIYVLNRIEGNFHSTVERDQDLTRPLKIEDHRVIRQIAHDGLGRWQIWYWYEIDERRETSELLTKLWQSLATLQGQHVAGVFAVAARCDVKCDSAAMLIHKFLESAENSLWLRNTVFNVELNR